MSSILPAELRCVIGEPFAGSGEVVVDGCKMIFQRFASIPIHAVEQFGGGTVCCVWWGERPREPARQESRPTIDGRTISILSFGKCFHFR